MDGAFERPRNGQKNDKAHPPIHPTSHVNNLVGDDKKVYDLVVRRFLACCSTNARGMETKVEIEIAGESFSATGAPAPAPAPRPPDCCSLIFARRSRRPSKELPRRLYLRQVEWEPSAGLPGRRDFHAVDVRAEGGLDQRAQLAHRGGPCRSHGQARHRCVFSSPSCRHRGWTERDLY